VGDVFILEAFGLKLFFVFSNKGLTDFYRIPETNASFLEATRAFLGYKVPKEVMEGEMPIIQRVLRRDFQKLWLVRLNESVREELDALGEEGSMDVFQWTKQVMHRAGFSAWVGAEATEKHTLQRLIKLFDQIDPEQGTRIYFLFPETFSHAFLRFSLLLPTSHVTSNNSRVPGHVFFIFDHHPSTKRRKGSTERVNHDFPRYLQTTSDGS
jgi:hypothetical protein